MDVLSATVAGSRRPIAIPSKSFVAGAHRTANHTTSPSSIDRPGPSTSRRKPKITYRSPSKQFPGDLCLERSSHTAASSSSILHATPNSTSHPKSALALHTSPTMSHYMQVAKPPLPLYHPQGRLALSLPEIDPETLGLRNARPITIDDPTRRSSSRARRPAPKLREADATVEPTATATDAPREKASPRKRRAGQGNAKRKRREPEDGDGTYPAKRTRNARPAAQTVSDVGSPRGSLAPAEEAKEAEVADTVEGLKVPERRSTRSRAAAAAAARKPNQPRRNSSASDETQTSLSASVVQNAGQMKKDGKDKLEADVETREQNLTNGRKGGDHGVGTAADTPEQISQAGKRGKEVEQSTERAPGIIPVRVVESPMDHADNQKEEGELSEEGELPSKG